MMGSFGIPDDVVMHYTDSVVLESPDENFQMTQPGAVLEFADFKRYLVRDGRDHGATYRFDSRVSQPIVENDEIAGVRYDGGEEVYADIVIDATGPAAPLAKALGVSDLERKRQAIGIEWEYEGVALDHPGYADLNDSMMLRLDHDLAPGGYAWIFHTGADTAKVGLCFIQNDKYGPSDDRVRIDDALTGWLDDDPGSPKPTASTTASIAARHISSRRNSSAPIGSWRSATPSPRSTRSGDRASTSACARGVRRPSRPIAVSPAGWTPLPTR